MPYADKDRRNEWKREYRKRPYVRAQEREAKRKYRATYNGSRVDTISRWKSRGILHADYDILFKTYYNTNKCDACQKVFKSTKDRHLDHCHESGSFRHILCMDCNLNEKWKQYINEN